MATQPQNKENTITFRLPPALKEELENEARYRGETLSLLLRDWVREMIARKKRERWLESQDPPTFDSDPGDNDGEPSR